MGTSSTATQRALQEPAGSISVSLLQCCFETASQAILVVSEDGLVRMVNRRTETVFGYDRSELIGQRLELLLPSRNRKAHGIHRAAYLAEAHTRPMAARLDLAGRRKDGSEFPVEIGFSSVQTDEGRLALGLVSDITDRKRAADELGRVNAELVQSNAELEQFAVAASHDLKEPLRMITSYLDLLSRRYGSQLDAEAREFIRYAVDGAARMRSLIDDLLGLASLGRMTLNPQRENAEVAVSAAVANLDTTIRESGARITCAPLPELLADMGLLAHVFQNLIGNAIKFRSADAPRIHITAEKTAAGYKFSVRDNGIGIETGQQSRVFGIFERLHCADDYPGNGIGLTIAQRIVERHGGRIWVESKTGEGSTFHFLIPDSIPALSD